MPSLLLRNRLRGAAVLGGLRGHGAARPCRPTPRRPARRALSGPATACGARARPVGGNRTGMDPGLRYASAKGGRGLRPEARFHGEQLSSSVRARGAGEACRAYRRRSPAAVDAIVDGLRRQDHGLGDEGRRFLEARPLLLALLDKNRVVGTTSFGHRFLGGAVEIESAAAYADALRAAYVEPSLGGAARRSWKGSMRSVRGGPARRPRRGGGTS